MVTNFRCLRLKRISLKIRPLKKYIFESRCKEPRNSEKTTFYSLLKYILCCRVTHKERDSKDELKLWYDMIMSHDDPMVKLSLLPWIKSFNSLFCLITNWGGGDYQIPIEECACHKTCLGGGDYLLRTSALPPLSHPFHVNLC